MSPALEALARRLHPADADRILSDLSSLEGYVRQSLREDPERILAAVLKSANGDPAWFADALALARTDFRDLLMGAGFAYDPKIHQGWLRDQAGPG